MTKIDLKLISNTDIHYFIEKGMRGAISYIAKTDSKANNKHMTDYDSSIFIVYLDANDLYGWVNFPYNGFKWLNQKEIDKFDVKSIDENSSNGYILEVDLKYPNKLHYLNNDYPLALEKREISNDLLPDYFLKIADKYGIKVVDVVKVVPNLDSESSSLQKSSVGYITWN